MLFKQLLGAPPQGLQGPGKFLFLIMFTGMNDPLPDLKVLGNWERPLRFYVPCGARDEHQAVSCKIKSSWSGLYFG